jgi:hypothetical protein
MEDSKKTREVRPHATLVLGEPFEGLRRGVDHGLVGEALL